MSLHNRSLGKKGEKEAENYLKSNGFTVRNRNFRSKFGEIDLIAVKDDTLYFIEVKTRTSNRFGEPYEAVRSEKIRHLQKAADFYLLKNNPKIYKLKLAVISIIDDGISTDIKFFEDMMS